MSRRYDKKRNDESIYNSNTRHVHIDDVSVVPKSSDSIFVKGLSDKVDAFDVEKAFEERLGGPLKCIFYKRDKNNRTVNVGIRFIDPEKARTAVNNYNKTVMLGSTIFIDYYQDIPAYSEYLESNDREDTRKLGRRDSRERSRSPVYQRDRRDRDGYDDYAAADYRSKNSYESRDYKDNDREKRYDKKRDRYDSQDDMYFKKEGSFRRNDNIRNEDSKYHRRDKFQEQDKGRNRREDDDVVVLSHTRPTEELSSSQESLRRKQLDLIEKLQYEELQRVNQSRLLNSGNDVANQSGILNPFSTPIAPVDPTQFVPPPGLIEINSKFSAPRAQPDYGAASSSRYSQRVDTHGKQPISSFHSAPTTGKLKLGSVTMERSTEIIRKDKIKHLHPDARAKVEAKIKMIDEEYKGDCTTFGFVTQLLINKDPALEDRLRFALAEVLNDLNNDYTKKMDDFIDLVAR